MVNKITKAFAPKILYFGKKITLNAFFGINYHINEHNFNVQVSYIILGKD